MRWKRRALPGQHVQRRRQTEVEQRLQLQLQHTRLKVTSHIDHRYNNILYTTVINTVNINNDRIYSPSRPIKINKKATTKRTQATTTLHSNDYYYLLLLFFLLLLLSVVVNTAMSVVCVKQMEII